MGRKKFCLAILLAVLGATSAFLIVYYLSGGEGDKVQAGGVSWLFIELYNRPAKAFVEITDRDLDSLPLLKQALAVLRTSQNSTATIKSTEDEVANTIAHLENLSVAKYGTSYGWGNVIKYKEQFYTVIQVIQD